MLACIDILLSYIFLVRFTQYQPFDPPPSSLALSRSWSTASVLLANDYVSCELNTLTKGVSIDLI